MHGYDDARAALLEVIARKLAEEARRRKGGVEKARELLGRVNWLRAAQITSSFIPMAVGLPPFGLAAEGLAVGAKMLAQRNDVPKDPDEAGGQLEPTTESTPPEAIHQIRKCFEQTLTEMEVTLVVLVDDLDRCLPRTSISTLEAIRLFLFLEHTAFVIAADEAMIKHAVRSHFGGVDEVLATNYFDKLIQIPIRVPPLGTQEVRAYMMMLFVANSSLASCEKENLRIEVCRQLAQSWKGLRVDRAFMQRVHDGLPNDLLGQLETAERLAPLMATASQIGGNPRLVKRFLNALSIRMTIAKAHGVGVDEAVVGKMLLFERCAVPAAYDELAQCVNNDNEGKARFLNAWEASALGGETLELSAPWDDGFIYEWLTLPPILADVDLRGVLYVSREHAPIITAQDRLSSDGAELLAAIVDFPETAIQMGHRIASLPRSDRTIVMDKILERARQEQQWGTPAILDAGLAVVSADGSQAQRLAAFLT